MSLETQAQRASDRLSTLDLDQLSAFRLLPISALAALIGSSAGFIAYGLYLLIAIVSNLVFFHRWGLEIPDLRSNPLGLWLVIVPALGGLVVGLMAKYGTPKIRGHGIPEAMEAVLVNRSRIPPRVALLKPISVAISIGTGGPFGAEGPIIQTGGAFGSLIGQIIHTTAAERKVLLACGAAAGMAAIFSSPIAAVILAIELLLFEFKSRSFIPLVIATTLATAVRFQLMGRGPLFKIGAIDFGIPHAIPFYALLGLVSGLSAVALSRALYWIEDQFERLPLDEMWWPAIGGLGLGLIGLVFPRALGVGYGTISDILSGRFALEMLLLIIVFKSLALLISLGSGTSGGLLAPMFLIGAAIGGSFASIINLIFPAAHLSPGAFALASMAATFGAASRATFTFIIFAFEITRDYDSVLPLMIASVIADGIALVLMKHSIMTEKLARRGLRVHQEYEPDILQQVTVAEVMDRTPPTVPPQIRLSELARMIGSGDASLSKHQALPIVDEERRLLGIITRGDILRAVSERDPEKTTVLEAGSTDLVVAYEDETVHEAVAKMLRHNIGRLPVVSRSQPDILTGYIGRAEVLKARLYKLHEEHVRQPGWIRRRLYLRALARAARARR